jgi:outer membrane protein assembly factor BamD
MRVFILLIILFIVSACSKNSEQLKQVIVGEDMEEQMIKVYEEGLEALNQGDVIFSAKKFNEVELLFPQSQWASRSSLMAAYAYYSQSYISRSINELNLFIKKYPKDKNIDYAYYLLALNYYESIVDEEHDLDPLIQSKKYFKKVIEDFPNTDFASDAKYKLELIDEIMASKEMYLGLHYIKKEKWIAAINRYLNVINYYQNTIYVEEALHRLVEIHYTIGLVKEGKRYANLLGYNYNSSEWYTKSYKIFNRNYNIFPYEKLKKDKKKDKINFFEKFKKLF